MKCNILNKASLVRGGAVALLLCLALNGYTHTSSDNKLPGFHFADNYVEAKIPFKYYSEKLIVIPVEVAGKYKLNMILDTGMRSIVLIGKRFMKLSTGKHEREALVAGYGHGKPSTGTVIPNIQVNMPGVVGNNVSVVVVKEKYLFPNINDVRIDGILGYQIFSKFRVHIDYQNQVITLSDPDPEFKQKEEYTSLPLTINDTKPFVHTKLFLNEQDAVSLKLMVDTGASKSLLLRSNKKKGIKIPRKRKAKLGIGINGTIHGYNGTAVKMSLEELNLLKPELSIYKDDNLEVSPHARYGSDGLIGSHILSQFDVIFDYPNQTLYLKKVTQSLSFK
ncbi:MAG: retropepsin-like aspartic protease [Bacteroidota bacterium]